MDIFLTYKSFAYKSKYIYNIENKSYHSIKPKAIYIIFIKTIIILMVITLMLIEFLKTNRNARRIFGKRELEIMIQQLDGLQLKQSEKNRLSRDIKPKLEFIKEIAEFRD